MEGWVPGKAHEIGLKNYIYFGITFSFLFELLNMTMFKRQKKNIVIRLKDPCLQKITKIILIWQNKSQPV
jgi:hypothetical protein